MLSRADLEIITRDYNIPGLALVLDIELLSSRLGINLSEQTYLNYKHGTSCVSSVVDVAGDAYAVMAYPRARFDEICARTEWFSGPAKATVLDDLCLALVPMPLDRCIKAAGKFALAESKEVFLRKLLKNSTLDGEMSMVLLRYKPKRRIVARLHVRGHPAAMVKCYNADDFGNALLGAELCTRVTGVKKLGIDHQRHTLATAWVRGPSLCPVLSGELRCDAMRDTGLWLAQFHDEPPETQLPFAHESRGSLTSPLLGMTRDFSQLAPRLASRLFQLVNQVNEVCVAVPLQTTLIHGDFSADQVIISTNEQGDERACECRPVVIDWDRTMIGSPLRDVGSFLARLDHQALDGSLEVDVARCAQQAFIRGYREHLPETDRRLVAAFHARALLLLVTDGFRHRNPDWHAQADALLGRAEALMKLSVAARPENQATPLPAMLAMALDVDEMREPLTRHITRDSEGLLLHSAHLLRHKPGRRAMIRYEGEVVSRQRVNRPVKVLGKLQFRRPDLKTPALHDLLRANGLNGSNRQGVGVPASLGVYPAANIWFQELVPGKELSVFLQARGDVEPFRLAGQALACLHTTSVRGFREWSLEDEAAVLERALDRAIQARPYLDERIQALSDISMQAFESLPTVTSRLIHRDFYQDQVLIDGKRVWIIDLDLSAQGDPAIDVANFLAHIREYAIRCYGGVTALDSLALAFQEGYASQGCELDAWRVSLLESLSLARHVHISTTFDERMHTTEPLLDHCEQQLKALVPRGDAVY